MFDLKMPYISYEIVRIHTPQDYTSRLEMKFEAELTRLVQNASSLDRVISILSTTVKC